VGKKVSKKKNTNSKKRTEAQFTVKVNGKKVEHPVRKFFVAAGLICLPLIGGMITTLFTINAQESFGKFNLDHPQ